MDKEALRRDKRRANLCGAYLLGANLSGAFLGDADTDSVIFEPKPDALSSIAFVFAFPYWFALLKREGRAGIWKVWEKERILRDNGQEKPVRLHISELRLKGVPREIRFSILSAFHIGWQELNVGQWIIRI